MNSTLSCLLAALLLWHASADGGCNEQVEPTGPFFNGLEVRLQEGAYELIAEMSGGDMAVTMVASVGVVFQTQSGSKDVMLEEGRPLDGGRVLFTSEELKGLCGWDTEGQSYTAQATLYETKGPPRGPDELVCGCAKPRGGPGYAPRSFCTLVPGNATTPAPEAMAHPENMTMPMGMAHAAHAMPAPAAKTQPAAARGPPRGRDGPAAAAAAPLRVGDKCRPPSGAGAEPGAGTPRACPPGTECLEVPARSTGFLGGANGTGAARHTCQLPLISFAGRSRPQALFPHWYAYGALALLLLAAPSCVAMCACVLLHNAGSFEQLEEDSDEE